MTTQERRRTIVASVNIMVGYVALLVAGGVAFLTSNANANRLADEARNADHIQCLAYKQAKEDVDQLFYSILDLLPPDGQLVAAIRHRIAERPPVSCDDR